MGFPRQSVLGSWNGPQSHGLKYSNKLPNIISFMAHLFLCRKTEGREEGEKEGKKREKVLSFIELLGWRKMY